jgi:hypothetical protein
MDSRIAVLKEWEAAFPTIIGERRRNELNAGIVSSTSRAISNIATNNYSIRRICWT